MHNERNPGGTFEPASIDAVKGGRTQMRRELRNYPASVNEDNWPRLFKQTTLLHFRERWEVGFKPSIQIHPQLAGLLSA